MTSPISRRLLLSSVALGAPLTLSACAKEEYARVEPKPDASTSTAPESATSGSDPQKWVHIGDSFTNGMGRWMEEISGLTGYEHINAGLAGNTSMKAGLNIGAISLQGKFISGAINPSDPNEIVDFIPENPTLNLGLQYPCVI